jgi:uncharacterized protein YecT (DUF1311 family)
MNSFCKTAARAIAVMAFCSAAANAQTRAGLGCSRARTQSALNDCAADKLRVAERGLKLVFDQLRAALSNPTRQTALTRAQLAWLSYRDKQCAFNASIFEGGSMWSMEYSTCQVALTNDRTNQVRTALAEERRR